jgi:hypothetical protein
MGEKMIEETNEEEMRENEDDEAAEEGENEDDEAAEEEDHTHRDNSF